MYELIITEKPKTSLRIADALADGKPLKKTEKGVPYYEITHNNKDIVIASAVGHLYSLGEKGKTSYNYPVFDIEWQPTYKKDKNAKFSKKYLDVLKKLSKDADSFTIACDYDIEGELIGLNVLRFACKQKDGRRMKFSTLTKPDLLNAYENASKTIDWAQAEAGEARHKMDYYYGINLSRALTSSIKAAGSFRVMSIGRVQGPTLKIIVDRENEIREFKPKPFWQLRLLGNVKNGDLEAWHEKDKFWKKEEAEKILENVKDKKGKIENVKKSEFKQDPPVPFDLTTLQIEVYRLFNISPKNTLSIAQELYTSGLISYPRTSSQILPEAIGYKKILGQLSKNKEYENLIKKLLSLPSLKPNNGKKTDPAHPAIYPTGVTANLTGKEGKIYDLIVKRFMATFSTAAVRETMEIKIDVNKEIFVSKGTRTKEKNWHVFYEPYVKLKEDELPEVSRDEEVDIKNINLLDKQTQPPRRYTQASIIKELEKRGLGTKSTRAQVLDTLYRRGYIQEKALEATELGIKIIETVGKFSPKILDEELTKHFEMEMAEIREKKKKGDEVVLEARDFLTNILKEFKKNEKEIGKSLIEATREAMRQASIIGKCPNCDEGTLVIKKGKFGRFIACDKHPDCKTTFSIPNTGYVKTSKKNCDKCDHPLITITRKGKRPQRVCINPDCPGKHEHDEKTKKEIDAIETGKVEKKCPKCDGKLVLRQSVYGKFYGCSTYPKCRYTEKLGS